MLRAMILEVALIDVVPGHEDAFAAAYRTARPVLAGTEGCRSVRMTRGEESPSRFVLLVEWESVEAPAELPGHRAVSAMAGAAGSALRRAAGGRALHGRRTGLGSGRRASFPSRSACGLGHRAPSAVRE